LHATSDISGVENVLKLPAAKKKKKEQVNTVSKNKSM
jgi:hypothetical protein